ncbi:hypothetical protein HOLleu_03249 [Holothuria leucospilota]|uniref:Uncharacterized protein n=1 Tax=Holothuria leucospilota TaxID=206669 RepID=A0A9Q1CRQ0_HOLLE|nr:hypothetical protein HOLleu_03249 [Holothuria leucospilota]
MAWFNPGSGKHDASGFLENRIRNVRRRDPAKSVETTPTTSKSSKMIDTINIDLSADDLDEANIAAMVTWLKYHNAPADQVKEMMGKTCKSRAAWIRKEKEKSVRELILEYPRLIDTDGMIDQDFRILFPDASNALFLKWTQNVQKLFDYGERQVNWKNLLKFSGKLDTDEQKSNLVLQMLPLLFPPGMKRRDGRKGPNVHATVAEASRAFIQVEKVKPVV